MPDETQICGPKAMIHSRSLGCGGFCILGGVVIFMLMVFVSLFDTPVGREIPPNEVCERQLERIGIAIVQYRKEHDGCLPESVVEKPAGLKHSWRALIAPYLGEQVRRWRRDQYKYKYEEAWDSEHNKQAIADTPLADYTCRVESRDGGYLYVTYVMLVRDGSKKAGERKQVMNSLPGDAVLVVESSGCKIEHGEPRDLDIETLFEGDSPFGIGKLNSHHSNYVRALRVDGKVIDIPKDISKERLKRLLEGSLTMRDRIAMNINTWIPVIMILCFLLICVVVAVRGHRRKRSSSPGV